MPKISTFGQVASTLAGALVVLAACNTGTVTGPDAGKPGTTTTKPGTGGDDVKVEAAKAAVLEFTLRLDDAPRNYSITALPSETTAVEIAVTAGGKKTSATVTKDMFKGGVAKITMEGLAPGKAKVEVAVKGAGGADLGTGTAEAEVEAGKTKPVRIVVRTKATTGALAIEVDAKEESFASLPPLQNRRLDRLAIPSLVLVFYGHNGFSRGVLGDPIPGGTFKEPPPEIEPVTLLKQVKNGSFQPEVSRKAIQKGFDGMDKYNAENPADDRGVTGPHYIAALKAIFGRDDATAKALSEALTPDMQTLDMTKATAFLTSGRMLKDDVVDTELQVLSGVKVATDKIGANDKEFSTSFPYLAAPF